MLFNIGFEDCSYYLSTVLKILSHVALKTLRDQVKQYQKMAPRETPVSVFKHSELLKEKKV